jgi:alpha-beta hydrolase superfamily lysophospholipase
MRSQNVSGERMNGYRYKALLSSTTRITGGVLFGVFVVLFLLYMFQEKLIFFPQKISEEEAEKIVKRFPNVESISIRTTDNITLRGWLVKTSNLQKSPLIIYFGGNAEEVSYLIHEAEKFDGWSLALINYRGYGLSEGKPGEKILYSDAISLYDCFVTREDIDSKRIIVMGRSLGTGVAVYLAQMRQVAAVILVSPYDSLVSLAKGIFPFLPVRLILNHRFDSLSRAPSIRVPLLAIVAEGDTIIPALHSEKLVEKWGGEHSLKVIKGEDHNTIHEDAIYWKTIQEFLSRF